MLKRLETKNHGVSRDFLADGISHHPNEDSGRSSQIEKLKPS